MVLVDTIPGSHTTGDRRAPDQRHSLLADRQPSRQAVPGRRPSRQGDQTIFTIVPKTKTVLLLQHNQPTARLRQLRREKPTTCTPIRMAMCTGNQMTDGNNGRGTTGRIPMHGRHNNLRRQTVRLSRGLPIRERVHLTGMPSRASAASSDRRATAGAARAEAEGGGGGKNGS